MKFKRTTREMEEIPLASTADIAFLLIVFFLAASALLELKGVIIPLPKKNAPPMQVLKKNLFKVRLNARGEYTYKKEVIALQALGQKMADAFRANKDLIIAVKVHPEAPAESIPRLVQVVQDLGLEKLSIGMQK